jgi:hypothetical protein
MLSFIMPILLNILLSLLIIYLLHELWEYFKNKFTVKKTIDKFQIQNEKYDRIINNLEQNIQTPQKDSMQNDFEKLNQELLDFSETQIENSELETI